MPSPGSARAANAATPADSPRADPEPTARAISQGSAAVAAIATALVAHHHFGGPEPGSAPHTRAP
ncbi:hypothetical protein GWR20_23675, partial [Mycolicibacter kumamotonensis]|nr:hypothetical protein [Mycolicibacter kumamotonensis]